MRKSQFLAGAVMALVGWAIFAGTCRAEPEDPDPTRIKTCDGLNLWAKWYQGGKNQNSDTVILVHGYGTDPTQPSWEALAKTLQKEGYSVLLFDMRGHGRSTDFKVFDDKELFVKSPFNKLAGYGTNPRLLKELKVKRFGANYYPYLANDLAAARRFVDSKHDIPECNTNRVFVITEKDSCPLVMMWIAAEFARQGSGPASLGADIKKNIAGKDIAGVIFLSWPTPGAATQAAAGQTTALNICNQIALGKVLGSETEFVAEQLRKKVAMAFFYGDKDKNAAANARIWFDKFGVAAGKKDDSEMVKYMIEVSGAEKLSGSKLLEIMEEKKDANGGVKKVSVVEGQLLTFLKKTKQKGINGSDYQEKRYATNLDFVPLPIEGGKWSLPK
jgi:hypothetical protein